MSDPQDAASPLDAVAWPEQLQARVVDSQPTPAIRGYDVEDDLACHYGLLEVLLLALGGELLDEDRRRAVEVALIFAAACSVAEAPVHAARLGRVIGVQHSALSGIAAMGLAEQARDQVQQQAELLTWLGSGEGEPPTSARSRDDDERAAVDRLRQALEHRGVEVPLLRADLGRFPALLAVLWWAGFRKPEQLETLLVLSRLGVAIAEATAVRPLSMKSYPMNLPAFAEVAP
ncbi:MAG: hypothetical protein ABIJ09_02660 [Pseudomonadota bacterium]